MNTAIKPVRMVFYKAGASNVIDVAVDRGEGYVGAYSGITVLEAHAQGAQLVTELEAVMLIDAAYVRAPVPCTAERFMDMLEVLPPQDWRETPDGESFKLEERTTGNITLIMVRMGDAYWEMQDMIYLSHNEVLAKVSALYDVACFNYEGTAMAMRRIVADFDGEGEREYIIGVSKHSDTLIEAMEGEDTGSAARATAIDEQVYFYAESDVLWGDVAALIEHIKQSEK